MSEHGVSFQRGTEIGLSLEVFADANYAGTATDRSLSGGTVVWVGAFASSGAGALLAGS